MKKLIEIKNAKAARSLHISYVPSDKCNYSCWYCFPGCNTGVVPWPDVDVVKKNLVHLIQYYKVNIEIDEVLLILGGGEPTLWPDLGELLTYVTSHTDCKIKIMTNGSRTLRWWKEYGHLFTHISVSIHHESVDTNHILSLVEILNEKDVNFGVNVLMDHTHWDKCIDIVETFKRSPQPFCLSTKPVYINGTINYNDSQTEYVMDHRKKQQPPVEVTNTVSLLFDDNSVVETQNENYPTMYSLNKFLDWECTLGVNYLFVDFAGNLTGTCNQLLFDKQDYFSINDVDFINKFNPILKPVVCQQTSCWCSPEVVLNKKRI